MKTFLTLTFVGTLLAAYKLGTLIEGTEEPIRQSVLLGVGVWLTIVGVVAFKPGQ